jgi:hypothetical protein
MVILGSSKPHRKDTWWSTGLSVAQANMTSVALGFSDILNPDNNSAQLHQLAI